MRPDAISKCTWALVIGAGAAFYFFLMPQQNKHKHLSAEEQQFVMYGSRPDRIAAARRDDDTEKRNHSHGDCSTVNADEALL